MNSDRNLILLRGLPGAGKSTLAALLSENGAYPVFSVDDYFIDPQTKEYEFDYKENHKAYRACEENARNALRSGISKVFVDNTFTLLWELEPYLSMASDFGYTLFVVTVENYHNGRNIHSIEFEQIRKMASKYRVRLFPEET
ncbi:ATP-binding protein [Leptospira ellisii]|uniref:ATP-binding protein n=1 Tax=Leptospira ellisii TaxID=2023197 RepID=A0AAE4QNU3_9LEPT|nr:ATP-binding protein [Leptospira ellisii]MDV6236010.1 ATP-binding protein [Leptospira ellisii]PKA02638.1 AAA family ATPase [Leptospira ellisii]